MRYQPHGFGLNSYVAVIISPVDIEMKKLLRSKKIKMTNCKKIEEKLRDRFKKNNHYVKNKTKGRQEGHAKWT